MEHGKDLVLIKSGAQGLSLAPKHCRASAGEAAQEIEARPAAAPEPRFLGIWNRKEPPISTN